MKKPDKTKRPEKPEAAVQPTQPETPRKAAADPGVIASTPVPPGEGIAAAATGGDVRPVKSTILGDGTDQNPPARRKSETSDQPSADLSPKSPFATATPEDASSGDANGPDRPNAAETRSATMAASAPVAAQGRRTGFWPVVLGGVVAAGLGSAATIWALPNLPAGWLPQDAADPVAAAPEVDTDAIRAEAVGAAEAAARSAAEETARTTAETVVSQEIAALREELAEQSQAVVTSPDNTASDDAAPTDATSDDAAPTDTAPADAEPAAVASDDAAPADPEGLASAAPQAPSVSPDEVEALRVRVEEQAAQIQELLDRPQIDPALAERVETLAGQADTLEQQIQTAAQAAQARINEAQAEAERLQQAAAESTRRAEAVAAIATLQSALDRGVTPDEAREALEGAGLETPDALAREVPSLESLQAGFPEAARAALRATLREDSTAGNGNLITNFLRAQTGARSVAPREGDDPDAVLSRADAAVQAGRIADAVAEVETLPEPARAASAMADWMAGAMAYRDAQAALSDLSAPSN